MEAKEKAQPQATGVALSPERERWVVLQKQCKAFISSGLLPRHVTEDKNRNALSPEVAMAKAVTIVSAGAEVGIPPLQSLRSIRIIDGTPSFAAELMLACCYRKIPGFGLSYETPKEKAHLECTVKCWRQGVEAQEFHFSLEDARKANLVRGGGGWEKYATDMLQSRAISRACRRIAPEATMGFYTPEELDSGDEVPHSTSVTVSSSSPAPVREAVPLNEEIIDYHRPATAGPIKNLTEKQFNRLFAIANSASWTKDEVHDLLFFLFKKENLKEINRGEYDVICNHLLNKKAKVAPRIEIGSDEDIRSAAQEGESASDHHASQ